MPPAIRSDLIKRSATGDASRQERRLLRATLSIHARTLGAPNRIRTELEIGTDPALAGALQASTQARDSKESELLEMGKLLSFSDRYPDRIAPAVRLRAEQTAAALSADIEALRGLVDAHVHLAVDDRRCSRKEAGGIRR